MSILRKIQILGILLVVSGVSYSFAFFGSNNDFIPKEYCVENFSNKGVIMEARITQFNERGAMTMLSSHFHFDEDDFYGEDVLKSLVREAYSMSYINNQNRLVRAFDANLSDMCLKYFERLGYDIEKERKVSFFRRVVNYFSS